MKRLPPKRLSLCVCVCARAHARCRTPIHMCTCDRERGERESEGERERAISLCYTSIHYECSLEQWQLKEFTESTHANSQLLLPTKP